MSAGYRSHFGSQRFSPGKPTEPTRGAELFRSGAYYNPSNLLVSLSIRPASRPFLPSPPAPRITAGSGRSAQGPTGDRKSGGEGQSGSVREDIGGRGMNKKKKIY